MEGPWEAYQTAEPPKPAKGPWNAYQAAPAAKPASSPYLPTSIVDTDLQRDGLRPTGDYRTPARERQLAAQGAGTVAPGRTSNHSRGTPDAPGAHDFVPTGADWNKALAEARGAPGVKDAFIEGAQGGQGRHIHVDMAAGDKPWLNYGPTPPAAAAAPPKPAQEGPPQPVGGRADPTKMRELAYGGPQLRQGKGPWTQYASDVLAGAKGGADLPNLKRKLVTQGNEGLGLHAAADVAGSAFGALQGGLSAAAKPLFEPKTADRYADEAEADTNRRHPSSLDLHHVATTAEKAETLGTIGAGLVPIGDAGATEEVAKAVPKFLRLPEGGGAGIVGVEKDPVERYGNALFRSGGHSTAGRLEALETLRDAPKEHVSDNTQEELTHALEHKLIDPDAKLPEHLQAAEAIRAPWAERQRVAANAYRKLRKGMGATDEDIDAEFQPDTGYVPRRVVGKSPGVDPADIEAQNRNPIGISGKRSLSTSTGSQRARNQIVLEDSSGQRQFVHRNKSNEEWKPGETREDPIHGTGTVKPATIKEIEAAGARDHNGAPLTYHKNALVNTMDEALKSERVLRNAQILEALTKDPKLAHRIEWHYPAETESGRTVQALQRNPKPKPDGFVELPNIPQLKGYAVSPDVAEVLRDYNPGKDEPLDKVFGTLNRALNASLFITPIPHAKNVATMGFIGRGWDWLPKGGNYARMMRTGREATQEVMTLGPKYREFLREGGSLRSGDEATKDFYDKMLRMTADQVASDPKVAKAMGVNVNPVELGKAMYEASHKSLWNASDIVMFQRYLELTSKGLSKREAIKEAERWIANYRIPPQVMRQRWASQVFQNSNVLNFGRYNYGKWRAIGEMVKGMASGDPDQRNEAMGKVMMAGVLSTIIYPVLDRVAQTVSGNPKAKVTRGGELTPIDALTDKEKGWAEKVAAIADPAPLNETLLEGANDRNLFTGRRIVEPGASPGGQAAQAGEYAAGKFYPAQLGLEATRPGGLAQAAGRLAGVGLPSDSAERGKAMASKYDRRDAKSRYKKDPLQQLLNTP